MAILANRIVLPTQFNHDESMKKEILLSYFPKITLKRHRDLTRIFATLDDAWKAEFDDLRQTGWEDQLINEFLSWRDNLDETKISAELARHQIECVTISDPDYPPLLKQIYDPPFCLFIRGRLSAENCLAVVGSRKFSIYGKQVAENLTEELAKRGITIVSGLALGIDSIAHESALRQNGKTIAVLGSGVDPLHIAPANHAALAERIIGKNGAIISEYPPGTMPSKYSFPQRNRIIAGLSMGVLVIEAAEKSGSLITAQCALDNGREVFAVPQNITSPTSFGTNNLIKSGARAITGVEDIIEALNIEKTITSVENRKNPPTLSPTETILMASITREPIHIDEIIKAGALPSNIVNGTLTLLEMKGIIKNLGGMMFVAV